MSTQYEFVKQHVFDEVSAFQEQLQLIQDDCIRRIKEISVSSELEDIKEELVEKLSNRYLFCVDEPDSASVVIGTARAGHFSWRSDNGFRDFASIELWLQRHPEFSISDEYGKAISLEQFKEVLEWCNS